MNPPINRAVIILVAILAIYGAFLHGWGHLMAFMMLLSVFMFVMAGIVRFFFSRRASAALWLLIIFVTIGVFALIGGWLIDFVLNAPDRRTGPSDLYSSVVAYLPPLSITLSGLGIALLAVTPFLRRHGGGRAVCLFTGIILVLFFMLPAIGSLIEGWRNDPEGLFPIVIYAAILASIVMLVRFISDNDRHDDDDHYHDHHQGGSPWISFGPRNWTR